MNRRSFATALSALLANACRRPAPGTVTSSGRPKSVHGDLVFLTREGCVNTPDMLLNVDDALRGLGLALDYEVVDIGKLPKTDPRVGYPTPTVLYRSRDLFGMPRPSPPYPEPS